MVNNLTVHIGHCWPVPIDYLLVGTRGLSFRLFMCPRLTRRPHPSLNVKATPAPIDSLITSRTDPALTAAFLVNILHLFHKKLWRLFLPLRKTASPTPWIP